MRLNSISTVSAVLLSAAIAGCSGGGASHLPAAATAQTVSAARVAQSTTAMPYAPTPDADSFYAQPASISGPPGTLLDSRPVTYAPDAAPQPNPAWQIKFVSRDLNGKAIASVATVVKPMTPFQLGPQPLVAVQYYENSLGSICAPSHSTTGSTANNPSNTEGSFPLQGLSEGMTLVFPDHLGPFTEYGIGPLHAHITLDAVRAALRFAPLGLNAHSPVGLEGYSGGAIATAWAAAIRRQYAPELHVVAVASGGTPANLHAVLEQFDNNVVANSLFSIGLDLVIGINRAFPRFLTPYLNAQGVAAANELKDGCGGQPSQTGQSVPTGHFANYTNVPDLLNLSSTVQTLAKFNLPQPNQTPIDRMYVYHSSVDELVPIAYTDTMVHTWCAAGVHIAYYRGYQGDHVSFDATMAPTVFAYLESRFAGAEDVTPAGTTTCN